MNNNRLINMVLCNKIKDVQRKELCGKQITGRSIHFVQ